MRTLLLIAMAAAALAQEPEAEGLQCVKDVTLPRYPVIAIQARVQLTITVRFRVTDTGIAADVALSGAGATPNGIAMLKPSVLRAVEEAAFDPACAGSWLTLNFRFELGTPASTRFRGPNTFVIMAEPVSIPTEA